MNIVNRVRKYLIKEKLNNDHVSILITTVLLNRKFDNQGLSKLIKIIKGDKDSICVFINAHRLYSFRHLLHPLYITFRDYLNNMLFTKEPEIQVLCLISCTSQIKFAINEVTPIDSKLITIGLISGSEDSLTNMLNKVLMLLNNEYQVIDLFIGCGCLRKIEVSKYCGEVKNEDDILNKIIDTYIERFE